MLICSYITVLFVSGHTSTVWALSFNSSGDKMVTCRYVKYHLFIIVNHFGLHLNFCGILTLACCGSDDLSVKVWETDSIGMQSGNGFAPW